jgi:glyoxylase-like metal-dependent hydrolase (beta-lactamase superfamily II)
MNLGNWQLDSVSGGAFSIDGGVAFGIVPRTLWGKLMPPDENNRVRLGANCVLARDGRQTILIDTGYGDKYSALDRNFWSLETGSPVLEGLARLGVNAADVHLVVLSHLHWDHAGGATQLDAQGRLVPTFPRARYVTGRIEWQDALSQAPELLTAYPLQNLQPLGEANVIELIEGNTQIVPGLTAIHTGGHTRGHMALKFESAGQQAMFIGDVCATSLHLHRMWNLSYDTYPLVTRRIKPRLLGEVADDGAWIIWPHDTRTVCARLERHPHRGFEVVDRRAQL